MNSLSITHVNSEYRELVAPNTHTGEIFQKEGIPGVLRYLKENQYYAIVTIPTTWGFVSQDSWLFGKVGFHAVLRLPGQRQCEWRPEPSNWEAQCSHIEVRSVPGKVIEKMWSTHKAIYPVYHQRGDFISGEGYCGYRPFANDCHSYVNAILTSNDQPKITFRRIDITYTHQ